MDKKKTAYERLTDKQRRFFDVYVAERSINAVVRLCDTDVRTAKGVYKSVSFQAALKELNEQLKETAVYNEAVIIDKLWFEYSDVDTPKNVKVNILVLLGKHIGMWANSLGAQKEKVTNNTTYQIINYQEEVKKEIAKNREEVEKVKDDIPEGIQIAAYPETIQ